MKLSWDETKRRRTLSERGLDFADAAPVFAGPTFEFPDDRKDYGEHRIVCVGFLRERMVAIVYVPEPGGRRIISMRKTNDREQKIYKAQMGRP
jgi:hypothetical protein